MNKIQDWNYARWLVKLRKMLRSTQHFENGVYPSPKAWRPLYDDGYTPHQAIQIDFGCKPNAPLNERIIVSIYWNTF